jgi:uncharacterized protein (TIGR00251 family)
MTEDLFTIEESDSTTKPTGDEAIATIVVRCHVQPGAGRPSVVGRRHNALHLRVAPPPADNRANVAAELLLAELFDVPKSSVSVVAGHKSRDKRLRVEGVELVRAQTVLAAATLDTAKGTSSNPGKVQRRF